MNNLSTKQHSVLPITAVIVLALSFSSACAWGRFGGHFGHYYHSGFYYHGYYGWPYYGPWWPDVRVIVPPIGAYVAYLPNGYTTFVIGADRYYYYNGVYFRPYADGYVIVSPPSETATTAAPAASAQTGSQAQAPATAGSGTEAKSLPSAPVTSPAATGQQKSASADTVTVGVPNSKGGFSSVKLIKHKEGYLGPQGEFYAGHPTVDQLRALYGN
jgi:hypothetical protein